MHIATLADNANQIRGSKYAIASRRVLGRGNDLVEIDPPGCYCPLYHRQHYLKNDMRWKNSSFASEFSDADYLPGIPGRRTDETRLAVVSAPS